VQQDKWGGAIELSILCRHYGREIAAYDIQTRRCDIYGQEYGALNWFSLAHRLGAVCCRPSEGASAAGVVWQ
jgi:hypothetical protein